MNTLLLTQKIKTKRKNKKKKKLDTLPSQTAYPASFETSTPWTDPRLPVDPANVIEGLKVMDMLKLLWSYYVMDKV